MVDLDFSTNSSRSSCLEIFCQVSGEIGIVSKPSSVLKSSKIFESYRHHKKLHFLI